MAQGYEGLGKGKKAVVAVMALAAILLAPIIFGFVMMWFYPLA